jgi:hypothetical protein
MFVTTTLLIFNFGYFILSLLNIFHTPTAGIKSQSGLTNANASSNNPVVILAVSMSKLGGYILP